MKFDLKIGLVKRFGSQVRAARQLEICESRLSCIVNEHREPTPAERQRLAAALGVDYFNDESQPLNAA